MPFSVSTRVALDGNGTTIPGGVVFIDESGTGVGPWIIAKTTIDPAGVNTQFVLSNNAAKCDVSSVNGVALGSPSAYGTSPGAVNVAGVNAFVTNTVTISGTVTANQGGTPWSQNLTQVNGVALGSPSNYGTSPGAVSVIGVNAFVTNTPSVTQSGTWTVQQGTPPWTVTVNDRTATGTVTAVNNTVTVSCAGDGNVGAIVTADTNITLAFEGSVDGTNFVTVNAYPIGGGASVTTTAANGSWSIPCSGFNQVRARVTVAGATPTATISLEAGAGSSQPAVVVSPTAANFNANVSGTVTANQGGAPWTVNPGTAANWGIGATAVAAPANAVQVGGPAMTTLPTAVTAGQLVGIAPDKFGRVVTLASSTRDNVAGSGVTTITSTTETTIIAAGAAGIFNDIHMILVSNTSATDVRVDIRDSTGGTIQFTFWAKANTNTVGFSSTVPWPQTTAANNWTAQLSAAVTDVRISALFVKNK